MKLAQTVSAAGGLVLMAAPAVLDYAGTAAAKVHWTVGPVLIAFAIVAAWQATRAVRWANLVPAAVLVVAPLFTSHPAAALAVGLIVAAAVAVTAPAGGPADRRAGGGWRSLVAATEPDSNPA